MSLVFLVVLAAVASTFWLILSNYATSVFLGAGDCWQLFGPYNHFADYAIHHGELPQWNPLVYNGAPFAADPQAWLFYPPNLLRSILNLHPTPYSTHAGINVMIILHLVIAGMSTYYFARAHTLSRGAAIIAVFGYILSANYVFRAFGHPHFCFILTWLPAWLLLTRALLRARGLVSKMKYAVGGGLICGLVITGGFPQITFLVCCAVMSYALLYLLLGLDAREEHSGALHYAARVLRSIRENMAYLLLIFVIGAGSAAALLLPLAEYAKYSDRTRAGNANLYEEGTKKEMEESPWHDLVVFTGEKNSEGIKGAGACILLLATVAWGHPRRREVAAFAALALIFLDVSMGQRFVFGRLVGLLMPFEFSNPGRATLVMCLPLSMLAGYGADGLSAHSDNWRSRLASTVVTLVAGAIILSTLYRGVTPHPFLDVSLAVFFLPLALALLMLGIPWLSGKRSWAALFALLVFAELLTWHSRFVPYTNGSAWHLWPGEMSSLHIPRRFDPRNYRRSAIEQQWHNYDFVPAMSGISPIHLSRVRQTICHPLLEETYRRHVTAYEPVGTQERGNHFLKRLLWLGREYVRGPLPPKHRPFPSTTTIFVPDQVPMPTLVEEVAWESIPYGGISGQFAHASQLDLTALPGSGKVRGATGTIALPEMVLPPKHCAMTFTYSSDCAFRLGSEFIDLDTGDRTYGMSLYCQAAASNYSQVSVVLPDFHRFRTELKLDLDDPSQGEVQLRVVDVFEDLSDENHLIRILHRSANRVEVQVGPLPASRLLLFTDPHYPGWRAYVDGRESPIFLANDVFKAVELTPGTHEVRFVYNNPLVSVGLIISSATVLLSCGFLIYASPLRGKYFPKGLAPRL